VYFTQCLAEIYTITYYIKEVFMAHMTDEEAKRLDEKWTKNPPKPGPNGTGYISKLKAANPTAHLITIDDFSADYLMTKAIADHKTPAEIIREMVWERITASA
jgi:hypothetical protein